MRAAPYWEQHAGRNQNDPERRFVSKPSAPETQAKCKRCGRTFKRERVEQKYCNARCRNAAAKARARKKIRAKSGDNRPVKKHLVRLHAPTWHAVNFGQKKPTKTVAFFDPFAVNFQAPVIDFLQRGDDLLRRVIAVECWSYPPIYRRPPRSGDAAVIEMDADGLPVLPVFLRRGGQ